MGCSRAAPPGGGHENDDLGTGILSGHAYGILDVRLAQGNKMLKGGWPGVALRGACIRGKLWWVCCCCCCCCCRLRFNGTCVR